MRTWLVQEVSAPRDLGGSLIGAVSNAYPLRKKWDQLVKKGVPGQKLKKHKHPCVASLPCCWPCFCCRFWLCWSCPLCSCPLCSYSCSLESSNPGLRRGYWNSKTSWTSVWEEYANRVQRSKIMLTDAAWVFYSVQKYSEAPTAGTALVADIPHDRMREFRQAAVEVSNAMSLEQLQAAVKWWLEHPEELRNKAATGQQWATHNVLTAHFFEQVTELYFEMVSRDAGGKAMVGRAFPSPFYVRCRGAGGEPWCKEKQKGKLPHYHSPEVAKHPASGGPVPTVAPPDTACAGIAPPAYQSRWRPLRWLLLQTKAAATTAADPSYRRLVAQSDHPYLKVIEHWGPGFAEYDESRALAENIKTKFGELDFFDVILTDDDWPKPAETAAFHARRTVVVVRRLECVQKSDCAESLRAHSPSIVLLGNPFEAMYNAELTDLSTRSLIVHQPRFSVHADLSQPGEKATDVLLVRRPGQNAESYPMMERWATVCASLKTAGKEVEVFDVAAPTEGADAAAADEELAGRIRRAKIVLGSAGAARYAPADWEEALVAGALVVSDMPYDRVREFRRLSVEVAADASAEQLQAVVEQWLGDGAGRLAKVQEGQAWVRFLCGRVVWRSHGVSRLLVSCRRRRRRTPWPATSSTT